MARSVNRVTLVGYLGGDPTSAKAANGSIITNFTVATSESWTDRNTGQRQERTEWHRIACFGKIAEIMAQYAKKGSRVYIEGKNRTRDWTDDQGVKRYTTEVIVDMSGEAIVLDPPPAGNNADARAQSQYESYIQGTPQDRTSSAENEAPAQAQGQDIQNDDVPY